MSDSLRDKMETDLMAKSRAAVPPRFDMRAFLAETGNAEIHARMDARFGVAPTTQQIQKWAARNQVSAGWAVLFAHTFDIPIEDLLPLAAQPDPRRAAALTALAGR